MSKIKGLSRKTIAFPVEVRIQQISTLSRACIVNNLRTFVPKDLSLLFPPHLETAIHPTYQLLNRELRTQSHRSTWISNRNTSSCMLLYQATHRIYIVHELRLHPRQIAIHPVREVS